MRTHPARAAHDDAVSFGHPSYKHLTDIFEGGHEVVMSAERFSAPAGPALCTLTASIRRGYEEEV